MRILIVDDDSTLRDLFAELLTKAGHEVETARNGVEGLTIFRKAELPFDAVVSDYQMSPMNGVLMLAAIYELQPGVRMVLASGDPPSARQLALADVPPEKVRVLRKPFGRSDLLEALS